MYKKLFALSITSTLSISSLIGTGIVLLNQNNNKNLVTHYNYNKSSEELPSIDDAEKQGIKIRTNPINGFDSLDVRDGSGNKLVLTTVQKPNELKTYGVALVNFESNEVLSHWEIPVEQEFVKNYELESDKKYVTNYTTNIIPGNNANEFFVLAGISNLADALNTVYTEYDPNAETFEEVVGADTVKTNLNDAPSIKIFKLKINDNNTLKLNEQEQDSNKGYYDFKYPEFDDNHKNGGLKFYTETGVFASFRAQQYKTANEVTTHGLGYLQYLQYGQLFQVNYENKDKDEFALINSWLSNDVSMGNLYAFYSTTTESLAPALSIIEYFYKDVLEPMIKDPGNNKPYQPKGNEEDTNEEDTTNYQIITKINDDNYEPAPKSDQLNKNTALALAFMYDFYAGQQITENTPVIYPTTGSPLYNTKYDTDTKKRRPYYGFVPGWFVFRPVDNYLIYGHVMNKDISVGYHVGNEVWATAIGSYYNSSENKYYLIDAWNWGYANRISRIRFIQIDLFAKSSCSKSDLSNYGTFHGHYDGDKKAGSINIFDYEECDKDKSYATKPMFIKVIDNEKNKNKVAIATNATNQILISKKVNEKPETYLTDIDLFDSDPDKKNIWLNMQYNKHTDTLTAINNEKIVTFVTNNYNSDNVETHEYTIPSDNIYVSINDVTSGNGQVLENTSSYIKAFQLTINNGFANSNVTDKIEDLTNHFMIQTATSNNSSEIIKINTPAELGYSITKKIENLGADVTNLSPLQLSDLPDDDIMKKFGVSDNNNNNNVVGYKIANVSTFNNKTGYFRVSSIISDPTDPTRRIFGFTKIEDDPISSIATGNSKYSIDKFGQSFGTIIFNTIQKIKESKNPCKDWSVEEIVDNFDIDSDDEKIKKLMENIFNLVVNTEESTWGNYDKKDYIIDIDNNNTSIATNTISFSVYYYNKITKKKILINDKEGNGFKKLEGIFATKLSSQTIMWIIIGTTLGIAAFLALGLGIGIPMRKNAKLSHQKMDTLTTAIGNVFKKMNDVNVKKKTPMLLRDKKQISSTYTKPIPKRPIDRSQKSN